MSDNEKLYGVPVVNLYTEGELRYFAEHSNDVEFLAAVRKVLAEQVESWCSDPANLNHGTTPLAPPVRPSVPFGHNTDNDPRKKLSCPWCGAVVMKANRRIHNEWHLSVRVSGEETP